jgi:hypothetical protein
VKHSFLYLLFCDCLLPWARRRATYQALRPGSLLRQSPLFCGRAWPLVKKQARQQAKPLPWLRPVMPSFELFCACDVLRAKALLQAIRLEPATEPAQRKCWQNRLQGKE